ncbi:MAG: ribosome silencing factor [Clostridia bacterium]|nr:ribosome silencing factor [Clostridia bacterium]
MDTTENNMVHRDLSGATSREIAEEAASALFRKKGINIRLFHVEETTVIADYYVICSARATTHAHALADEVNYRLGLCNVHAQRTEGRDGGEWLLVDLGTVLVHVFTRDAREYYNLERLLPQEGEADLTDLFEELKNKLESGEIEA